MPATALAPLFVALALTLSTTGIAQSSAPVRALLIAGGGHDDRARQIILTEGISARIEIVWTIVQVDDTSSPADQLFRKDSGWEKDFDVIVHHQNLTKSPTPAWIRRVLKTHRKGLPAVVLHDAVPGAMDRRDEWFKFTGVILESQAQDYPFLVQPRVADHPITRQLAPYWRTPRGKLMPVGKRLRGVQPLAVARSRETGHDEMCIWTNRYGKGRVFATSIGRHFETVEDPVYLDFLTRGLLWAVDPQAEVALKTPTVRFNHALKKPAKASSGGGWNGPKVAVDGRIGRVWLAASKELPQWWEVDLETPMDLTGCRLFWTRSDKTYTYRVEGSRDRDDWVMLVNRSGAEGAVPPQFRYDFTASGIRYVRITITAIAGGHWASLGEVEIYGHKRVDQPGTAPRTPGEYDTEQVMNWFERPDGFAAVVFAAPPDVGYPTCVSAAGSGEVYIAEDGNGALDQNTGRGRIFRCVDEDGDGDADRFDVFVDQLDSPRGLIAMGDALWVLHPPDLSVFRDTDGDGVADERETLVKGIGFSLDVRGSDHATNNIRLGIDGWIYIAVGDYGFKKAVGKDGISFGMRGGGIVRVRPDGAQLEPYVKGLRNIYDVALDPLLNSFTRDNTNDGGGWDIRLSQIVAGAHYGYPSWFKNFPDELLPPLADYGGGSGTGALWLDEPGFPKGFGNALYTCDWGRGVFRHPLKADGAGYTAEQEEFLKFHQPMDMDVDGNSNLYVCSWKNGVFRFQREPVGYVARVTYPGLEPAVFPDLKTANRAQLVRHLASPSQVCRINAQQEILRRGPNRIFTRELRRLAESAGPLAHRVAAIFTLKQLRGVNAHAFLVRLAEDETVREFALRALADRRDETRGVPVNLFISALQDNNPRVTLQALIGLERLGAKQAAGAMLPLAASADPVIAHTAYRMLARLGAAAACLKGLNAASPELVAGALRALRQMHLPEVVAGLIDALHRADSDERRGDLLTALIRLYHREAPWSGKFNWWGTRPDTRGPYYDPETWEESERIANAVDRSIQDGSSPLRQAAIKQLERHRINEGPLAHWVPKKEEAPTEQEDKDADAVAKTLASSAPAEGRALNDLPYDDLVAQASQAAGNVKLGRKLFKTQSCYVCHTVSKNQTPRGPHLGGISRYSRAQLIESIIKPNAKLAQGFETHWFQVKDGDEYEGFVVWEAADEVEIRTVDGVWIVMKTEDIEERGTREASMMPPGLVKNLTVKEFASLLAYLESL